LLSIGSSYDGFYASSGEIAAVIVDNTVRIVYLHI